MASLQVSYYRPSLRIPLVYLAFFILLLSLKFVFTHELVRFDLSWRIAVAIGSIYLIISFLRRATTVYALDPHEVSVIKGILMRKVTRLPLIRVTDYQIRASVLERLCSVGDCILNTPGGKGYEIRLVELDKKSLGECSR